MIGRIKKNLEELLIKKNFELLFLKFFGYISSIVLTIILVRYLSPSALGAFYYIMAISGILTYVFGLGISGAIIPLMSEGKFLHNEIWTAMLYAGAIIGILLFSILYFSNYALNIFSTRIELFLWYSSMIAPLKIIQLNFYNYFLSRGKLLLALILNEGNGRNFIMLFFIGISFQIGNEINLNTILKIFILSNLIIVIIGLIFSFNFARLINIECLKNYSLLSIRFYPSLVTLNSTSNLFDIFINNLFGPISLAAFSLAKRLTSPLLFFSEIIGMYFIRVANLFFKRENEKVIGLHNKCVFYSFVLTIFLTLCYIPLLFTFIADYLNFNSFENVEEILIICLLGTLIQSIFIFSKSFLRVTAKYMQTTILDLGVIITGSIIFYLLYIFQIDQPIFGPLSIITIISLKSIFAYLIFKRIVY